MMKSDLKTISISEPRGREGSCKFRVVLFAGFILIIVWMTLILEFGKTYQWTGKSKYLEAPESCKCFTNNSDVKAMMDSYGYSHETGNMSTIHCPLTIVSKGNLAEDMCSYASLYAISRLNDRPGFVPVRTELNLARYFQLSMPILTSEVSKKIMWTTQAIPIDWRDDSQYENLPCFPVRLEGSPCSWTFYNYFISDIKKEFKFSPRVNAEVRAFLTKVRHNRTTATFVGVHVQRGSYVDLMQKVYKGVLPSSRWISIAMNRFRSRFKNALFIVSSDDKQWCEDKIDTSKGDVYFAWNDLVDDPGRELAILTHCNHSIITVGEFGYWAAYLAGGNTIYTTEFVPKYSSYYVTRHKDSLALPHWEGMPVDVTSDDDV